MTDPRIGEIIGDFHIESVIGRGGMGVVYLANDSRLERQIALKFIAPEFLGDEQLRARFLREPRMAARLTHPNIIPIFQAGETADGDLYIAMPYIDGPDLGTRLRQGPLHKREILRILGEVANALDAAHGAGLVHRDVKPGNVLLSGRDVVEPHVYLTDFGLSRRTTSNSQLSVPGQFVGTPDYVAPEQIQGLAVDGRADQYALACVLYQCLTGKPPFPRDEVLAIAIAHLSDPPPRVTDSLSDVRPQIDAVVMRAMAKSPEERYATCGELIDAAYGALFEERRKRKRPARAPENTLVESVTLISDVEPAATEREAPAIPTRISPPTLEPTKATVREPQPTALSPDTAASPEATAATPNETVASRNETVVSEQETAAPPRDVMPTAKGQQPAVRGKEVPTIQEPLSTKDTEPKGRSAASRKRRWVLVASIIAVVAAGGTSYALLAGRSAPKATPSNSPTKSATPPALITFSRCTGASTRTDPCFDIDGNGYEHHFEAYPYRYAVDGNTKTSWVIGLDPSLPDDTFAPTGKGAYVLLIFRVPVRVKSISVIPGGGKDGVQDFDGNRRVRRIDFIFDHGRTKPRTFNTSGATPQSTDILDYVSRSIKVLILETTNDGRPYTAITEIVVKGTVAST